MSLVTFIVFLFFLKQYLLWLGAGSIDRIIFTLSDAIICGFTRYTPVCLQNYIVNGVESHNTFECRAHNWVIRNFTRKLQYCSSCLERAFSISYLLLTVIMVIPLHMMAYPMYIFWGIYWTYQFINFYFSKGPEPLQATNFKWSYAETTPIRHVAYLVVFIRPRFIIFNLFAKTLQISNKPRKFGIINFIVILIRVVIGVFIRWILGISVLIVYDIIRVWPFISEMHSVDKYLGKAWYIRWFNFVNRAVTLVYPVGPSRWYMVSMHPFNLWTATGNKFSKIIVDEYLFNYYTISRTPLANFNVELNRDFEICLEIHK